MELSAEIVELVRRAKAGDENSFEDLIRLFAPRIFSVAVGILSNREDAEEVVQDVFIKAHKNIKDLREERLFPAWINRITVNLCRNRYAWNKVRGSGLNISIEQPVSEDPEDGQKSEMQFASEAPPPDKALCNAETEEKILEAMKKLPETYREAVILRDVNNLSYAEIADLLGCTVEAVKSRISRGRAIIARFLEGKL